MSGIPPGYSNALAVTSSVYLDATQKLLFNRTWLVNYQLKIKNIQEDLKEQIEDQRTHFNALKLDDESQWESWTKWKPNRRTINNLAEALIFYSKALDFLRSKQTEIDLLMALQKDPDAVEPHRLAQHQVMHQSKLDAMEKASPSDCEEIMAEIERAMYMTSNDDGKFEASLCLGKTFSEIKFYYTTPFEGQETIKISFQLRIGRDATRVYRPSARGYIEDELENVGKKAKKKNAKRMDPMKRPGPKKKGQRSRSPAWEPKLSASLPESCPPTPTRSERITNSQPLPRPKVNYF